MKSQAYIIITLGLIVFLGSFFVTVAMREKSSGDNAKDSNEMTHSASELSSGPCKQDETDRNYTNLEASLNNPLHVCRLSLRNSDLGEIPQGVYEMKNLIQLDLVDSGIVDIPGDIAKLQSMRVLLLSGNQITSIPSQMREIDRLRRVDLRGNPISEGEQDRIRQLLPDVMVEF